jgi:hypothetical protein
MTMTTTAPFTDAPAAQDAAEAGHRASAKRAAAAGGYLPSQCPLGLHDNLHPGLDGECEDCELQGMA